MREPKGVRKERLEKELERLVDGFKSWKGIFGESVPDGYEETLSRAMERQMFFREILKLRKQLQLEKGGIR